MKYIVVTPEYSTVIPILDDGSGPIEYGRDVWEGEADNMKEAKIKAIKSIEFRRWVKEARSDNRNPFSGLRAEVEK